eukprot:6213688-Pleurochrysis_carterae.AAC.1
MPLVKGADLNGTASGDPTDLRFNRPYRASPTGLHLPDLLVTYDHQVPPLGICDMLGTAKSTEIYGQIHLNVKNAELEVTTPASSQLASHIPNRPHTKNSQYRKQEPIGMRGACQSPYYPLTARCTHKIRERLLSARQGFSMQPGHDVH